MSNLQNGSNDLDNNNVIGHDHRIRIKIFEAKNFYHCNKADSFCVITTNNISEDEKTIERPSVKVSKPLIRKMSNAFNSGTVVRKGSCNSTLIDKNALEMMTSQNEKLKGIQFETKLIPCNSNPFWGEFFEIILKKNFYSIKVELFLKNAILNYPVGEIFLYKYEMEQNKFGKAFEYWKPLNSKNLSIKKEVNENGHSHIFESISDDYIHDCIICENVITDDGLICSNCHVTTHVKCSQNLCNCNACGTIRIEYRYIDFPILPLKHYHKLKELIIDEKMDSVNLLAKAVDSKDEAVREIITILNEENLAVPFLSNQCKMEISSTKVCETLFRGTSFCTKSVDYFMKLICKNYLEDTVGLIIKRIIKQHKNCEIDPKKLLDENGDYLVDSGQVPEENIENLKEYARLLLDSIIASFEYFPEELSELFNNIQSYAIKEFPKFKNVRFSCISAFIFLRLFSPAILNPQLFGLIDENLKRKEVRTLTLLSKFVQQTANLVEYNNSKENYMNVLNDLVKEYIPSIKKFINSISQVQQKSVMKPKKSLFNFGNINIFKKKTNDCNIPIEEKEKNQANLERRFSSVHRLINRNLDNIKKAMNNSIEEIRTFQKLKKVIEELNEKAGIKKK